MGHREPKPEAETRVLLLQGPSSPFYWHLGRALRARGAEVTRILFNPGDGLYWSPRAGRSERCKVAAVDYRDWIKARMAALGITDLVALGDARPYHREAILAGRAMTAAPRMHVIEQGLLRRYGILHDPDGTGTRSRIPARFGAFQARHSTRHHPPQSANFLQYVAYDLGYHLANTALGWAISPRYIPPMPLPQWYEYGGWLRKIPSIPKRRRADRHVAQYLKKESAPVMLVPLQLAMDAQIRDFGRGMGMAAWLDLILDSFAAYAPPDLQLLIKRHPLDNGLIPWAKRIAARSQPRVHYAEHLDMMALLPRMRGVVTVNSTAGLEAILAGVPCKLLGEACYDIPGLVSDRDLAAFWSDPGSVDRDRAAAFEAFLQAECHVPGAFDGPGAKTAAAHLADRIVSPR